MNMVAVAVVSEDGFLTRGDGAMLSSWTSKEDKTFYRQKLNSHSLYLMGSKTYESAKRSLNTTAVKIVLTNTPNKYHPKPNTIFTSQPITNIFKNFSLEYSEMLVLGGGSIYQQMLEQKLIDEFYLTVEPVNNESGVRLFTNEKYLAENNLKLTNTKKLNRSGTLLKHYVRK